MGGHLANHLQEMQTVEGHQPAKIKRSRVQNHRGGLGLAIIPSPIIGRDKEVVVCPGPKIIQLLRRMLMKWHC